MLISSIQVSISSKKVSRETQQYCNTSVPRLNTTMAITYTTSTESVTELC